MMLFLLFFLLLSSQAVQCSRAVPAVDAGLFSPCKCPQQAGSDGSTHAASISMLVGAVDQKHVLMKVRMLPTSASALLETVKADVKGSTSPAAWVTGLVDSMTAATAQQLQVPRSLVKATLESSLGSGLNVPPAAPNRQQAAVDALAEFFAETTGSSSLLVGLNMVHSNTSSSPKDGTSPSAYGTAGAGSILALATLNGAVGDLAHILHMADTMQRRCPELFQQGAVLNMSAPGSPVRNHSSSCTAWLSDWYMPVLRPDAELKARPKASALLPGAAAALRSADKANTSALDRGPSAAGADTTYPATVALPLEINIKLSIKLLLPQQGVDPDALVNRARAWLQSAALDNILQGHGLHIGAGSPAHLVTLMSTPSADGQYKGIDEEIMVDGITPAAAAAAAAAATGSVKQGSTGSAGVHHEPQPELGHGHRRSSSSRPGMSAWGRLQPSDLQPLVLSPEVAAALISAQADPAAASDPAAPDDEISRRTVLGAIVGAVLGSATVGAGLAMVVTAVLRRRRTLQLQGGAAGPGCQLLGAGDASRRGRDSAGGSGSVSGRRQRRSRKRYLKYLPNSFAPHLLPVTAPPASPCAGNSSCAGTSSPCPSSTWGGMEQSPAATAAAGDVQGLPLFSQQFMQAQQLMQCTQHPQQQQQPQHTPEALQRQVAGLASSSGITAQSMSSIRDGRMHPAPHPLNSINTRLGGRSIDPPLQQQGSSRQLVLQHQQPSHQHSPAPIVGNSAQLPLQRSSHPLAIAARPQQQQQHAHSRLGSRLLQGLALLRPSASDPLVQPPTRGDVRVVQLGDLSSANIRDGSAAVPTRSDLCSDSVSSQARMDLLHAMQRPMSAGASDDHGSSVMSRSNSSRSFGELSTGGGAVSPAGTSSGAASPAGEAQNLHTPPVLASQASLSTAQHDSLPAASQTDCSAGFYGPQRLQQSGDSTEQGTLPHVALPADQLVQQQQPRIAWDGANTSPSVAADCSTARQGDTSSVEQGAGTNNALAPNQASSSMAHAAGSSVITGAGSGQGGRPDRHATPFLHYDFSAVSVE